jgi:hypothetical protein
MNATRQAVEAAYHILDLPPGADISEVRARFRTRVKSVHPDIAAPTPETLADLQRLLSAYDTLRGTAPRRHELIVSPELALKGGVRRVRIEQQDVLVRLPAGAQSGLVLTPVGDPRWRIHVQVDETVPSDAADAGAGARSEAQELAEDAAGVLRAFCDRYVRASPSARLARWARTGAA